VQERGGEKREGEKEREKSSFFRVSLFLPYDRPFWGGEEGGRGKKKKKTSVFQQIREAPLIIEVFDCSAGGGRRGEEKKKKFDSTPVSHQK